MVRLRRAVGAAADVVLRVECVEAASLPARPELVSARMLRHGDRHPTHIANSEHGLETEERAGSRLRIVELTATDSDTVLQLF